MCKFSKNVKSKLYHIEYSKTRGANSVDPGEVAHYEPLHQDLRCLQIKLFSSLVLKELTKKQDVNFRKPITVNFHTQRLL